MKRSVEQGTPSGRASTIEAVFVEVIDASREAVWEALTSPEFTEKYWHSTRVRSDFTAGSVIEFLVDDAAVGCVGEILLADSPRSCRIPGVFREIPWFETRLRRG